MAERAEDGDLLARASSAASARVPRPTGSIRKPSSPVGRAAERERPRQRAARRLEHEELTGRRRGRARRGRAEERVGADLLDGEHRAPLTTRHGTPSTRRFALNDRCDWAGERHPREDIVRGGCALPAGIVVSSRGSSWLTPGRRRDRPRWSEAPCLSGCCRAATSSPNGNGSVPRARASLPAC